MTRRGWARVEAVALVVGLALAVIALFCGVVYVRERVDRMHEDAARAIDRSRPLARKAGAALERWLDRVGTPPAPPCGGVP